MIFVRLMQMSRAAPVAALLKQDPFHKVDTRLHHTSPNAQNQQDWTESVEEIVAVGVVCIGLGLHYMREKAWWKNNRAVITPLAEKITDADALHKEASELKKEVKALHKAEAKLKELGNLFKSLDFYGDEEGVIKSESLISELNPMIEQVSSLAAKRSDLAMEKTKQAAKIIQSVDLKKKLTFKQNCYLHARVKLQQIGVINLKSGDE
jgi:hypothetical protein